MENIKLEKAGKKLTKDVSKKPNNVITIKVYDNDFEVSATEGLDMLDLYCIFVSALDYLHNYADYLDTKESVTLQ